MMPDVYWIRDIEPLRLALMPRPRGGEWLEDEIAGWERLGIDVVVSLLHPYEADELEISKEGSLCSARGIQYRSFPIQDRGVPESATPSLPLQMSWRFSSKVAQRLQSTVALALGGPRWRRDLCC